MQGCVVYSVVPINNRFPVQMLKSTADLGGVKLDPVFLEAWRAHVVNVKLQVTTIHDSEHQTQSIFGLICIC